MRRRRAALIALCLLVCLLAVPVVLTWREVRQERLDQQLIGAVKHNDANSVALCLKQGANANAVDTLPDNRPIWQRLRDRLLGKSHKPSSTYSGLMIALLPDDKTEIGEITQNYPVSPEPVEVVRVLLAAGAKVDKHYPHGESLLAVAAFDGYSHCVQMLLEAGANVHEGDAEGETALFYAVERDQPGTVKVLLERGASVNARSKWEETPLIRACRQGDVQCVRILLAHGADVHLTMGEHTAMSTALQWRGHPGTAEILHLLRQAGETE